MITCFFYVHLYKKIKDIFIIYVYIMTHAYNIVMWKEWDHYVGRILENNISSFWDTEKECIKNTEEALSLYLENNKTDEIIDIKSPSLSQINYNYA